MRILICNERFLFRFGVDRVLLMLAKEWREMGHEVILMGNKMDPASVNKCADRFIRVPEAPAYPEGNEYTLNYLQAHWDEWFDENSRPEIALVAGWPFYLCLGFLRAKTGSAIFHDYGAVPLQGMSGEALAIQKRLRKMRREHLGEANRVIAISRFLEKSQSIPDTRGKIPTSTVHIAVDHIAGRLWATEELKLEQSDVTDEVRALKQQGVKIIFQPGRWENGNYKNSGGTVELIRALKRKGIDHRILVLSDAKSLESVPADARENYLCLGFIDDETMKTLMELSDAGVSPTLWEGFDLPLGEMQYLDKPMLVMNVGAHPEVAVDPWFLCRSSREMARKMVKILQGEMPLTQEAFREKCAAFRQVFTWKNCAKQMIAEMEEALRCATVVYIDVTNACHDPANSGVMRVTRKLSRHLQERMQTRFVLWDGSIGEFVLPYRKEIDQLSAYDGPRAGQIRDRSPEGKPRKRMTEILGEAEGERRVFLFTETADHRMLESAIPWLHGNGFAVAAVFYDAIPILRPEFVSEAVHSNHGLYMTCLAETELVIPIEEHNGTDLKAFWAQKGIESRARVETVELAAEIDGQPRSRTKLESLPEKKQILFVSTLEPRKNHIRFLKAADAMFRAHPEIARNTVIRLVGNRYAGKEEIAAFVEDFCLKHENVQWLGVVDDRTLKGEYEACTFTAYPSEIEGFGMPIIESLWAGKPCLCSNEGSIGDLGAAGGCCQTNVKDEGALAEALYRMLTDETYLLKLQHEATERPITGWAEYADRVAGLLGGVARKGEGRKAGRIPLGIARAIEEAISAGEGLRMITVSNYYPPNTMGGAEIIAHHQLKALEAEKLATGIAFSLDTTESRRYGDVSMEKWDGITVIRVSVDSRQSDPAGITFYNPDINEVFRELCGMIRPEVVHIHNLINMSLGIVDIARENGAKIVFTLHDNWGFCYKNTMLDNEGKLCEDPFRCERCREVFETKEWRIPMAVRWDWFRRTIEKADAFISPSEYLARSYIRAGFDAWKTHVLWNGIDYAIYAGTERVPSDEVRITYAGYFGSHKGVEVLIRAVASNKDRKIRLNLVGNGAEEPHYRRLAGELGIGDRIRYWGRVPNEEMAKVFRETDIYCLPSVWPENQPVSITEAMASGVPVIASNLGGSRELVQDGVTGYLAEAGNAEDLAAKIRAMCDDAEMREQMGQAGQKRMAENDYRRNARKLAELYRSLEPKKETHARRMILFKGRRLPDAIGQATRLDVVPAEWIQDKEDLKQAAAFVIPAGETAEEGDLEIIERYRLPVIAPDGEARRLEAEGRRIISCAGEEEMLQAIMAVH